MINITVSETDFFLPEDGSAAEKQFLDLLSKLSEVWISAFGFTLQPMFDELKKADAAGAKIHLLLDHSQAVGQAEAPKVKDLAANLKHGDLTITTAGIHSGAPEQIWHWKGMVVQSTDGKEKYCWEGSTNFSLSGWLQGNSARIFRSNAWAQVFVHQFDEHKSWARENEPQYQV
jgi:PLD-like domain